jgi:60 kDa SS-A/Ro ribonucleoprotein
MAKISTASFHRRRSIPVTEPIPGRKEMVPNSTGGYAWKVTEWDQLDRFLILGVTGGTYYIGERKLTDDNAAAVKACIQLDAGRVVDRVVEVSVGGLALRNDPAIFALALVAASNDAEAKAKVAAALPQVCRTGTHLLHYGDYVNALRGWGPSVRKSVASWYTGREADNLAFQVGKYQSRDNWSHRDLLRLTHPKAPNEATDAVFRWIVGGMEAVNGRTVKRKDGSSVKYPSLREHLPRFLAAMEEVKAAKKAKDVVRLITEHNLPREVIPTEWLNEVEVWEALLQKMPLTAMIRNLGKMTSIGLVRPLSAGARLVKERLGNKDYLRKSRIHPISVLVAARTYAQGKGVKGSLSWSPVPAVQTALDEAFYATFGNVRKIGKPVLIALDVSGSMGSSAAGTVLRACEATAAMSLVWLNTEPEVHVFGFGSTFRELGIRKGMTLEAACQKAVQANFGSTNIGLAVEYAEQHKIDVGGFIVMTDNEGNTGEQPAKVMERYRKARVPDARLVMAATSANQYRASDPNDKWSLDVAGFDPSVPTVVNNFIRGSAGEETVDEPESEE